MKNKVKPYGGHELGKTYLCGYWRQKYTVTAVHDDVPVVTVRWEDGHSTTHSTALEKHDKEVRTEMGEYLETESGFASALIDMEG